MLSCWFSYSFIQIMPYICLPYYLAAFIIQYGLIRLPQIYNPFMSLCISFLIFPV